MKLFVKKHMPECVHRSADETYTQSSILL